MSETDLAEAHRKDCLKILKWVCWVRHLNLSTGILTPPFIVIKISVTPSRERYSSF